MKTMFDYAELKSVEKIAFNRTSTVEKCNLRS